MCVHQRHWTVDIQGKGGDMKAQEVFEDMKQIDEFRKYSLI